MKIFNPIEEITESAQFQWVQDKACDILFKIIIIEAKVMIPLLKFVGIEQ